MSIFAHYRICAGDAKAKAFSSVSLQVARGEGVLILINWLMASMLRELTHSGHLRVLQGFASTTTRFLSLLPAERGRQVELVDKCWEGIPSNPV
jgi:hypothetical protein